jgi:meso-butanediol dehydrogenase / (S,S)-butanediol dehydrogenase / diacetyl reductase
MTAINLRGILLCYQEAARQMIRQDKGGKIIGAASILAYRPFPMLGRYSVSKWGRAGLRRPRRWSGPSITSASTRTAPE